MGGDDGGADDVDADDVDADADVAIVGYGPVGATLAILLAQLGHRVVVAERWPRPYPLPRAVHFDAEVGRILQSCGLGTGLAAISQPGDIYEWRNGAGVTLLRFGRVGAGASGWPESSMFNQPALEVLLDSRVRSLDRIAVRRGVEIDAVDQSAGTVTMRGHDATGEAVGVRTRYLVGCDGARSTVRSLIGVPVADLGFFYDWLIVDVVLDEPRTYDPVNLQICDPSRPTTAVSGGPGRRRWEFMRLPHESLDELNEAERAWELLAEWDVTPDNATLERHAVYTFAASCAEEWRDRHVLLAGDAAHQMPPFAGQGMGAGVRDAANLAWKLHLVLAGQADEALLDTYGTERRPDARVAIDFSVELGKIICVPDPEEAAARDEAMAASVGADPVDAPDPPALTDGLFHPTAPLAGRLFCQGVVDVAGRSGRFDDLLGGGWRLVTIDTAPLEIGHTLGEWFAGIGGRVVGIAGATDATGATGSAPATAVTAATDAGGTYARWFASHGATWALQRPDFHLFGTATDAAAAGDLLAHLHDQLAK